MVAPRQIHRSKWSQRGGRELFIFLLLSLVVLVFSWIFLSSNEQQSVDGGHSNTATSSVDPIFSFDYLDCQQYLDHALLEQVNATGDPFENSKLHATYVANYAPPFWISKMDASMTVFREKTFREYTASIAKRMLQWDNLVLGVDGKVLKNGMQIIVYKPAEDNFGWLFSLWAGAHGRVVSVLYPQSRKTSIHLCESARMNQWSSPQFRILTQQVASDEKIVKALSNMQQSSSLTLLLMLHGKNLFDPFISTIISSQSLGYILWECDHSSITKENEEKLEVLLKDYNALASNRNRRKEYTLFERK